MIKKYIKDLHKKPESHRKKVTYGVSAGVTLVIGLIWISSFAYLNNFHPNSTLAVADTSTQNTIASNKKTSSDGPFAVVGSNLSNAFQGIRSAMGIHDGSRQNATATLEYIPD